MVIGTQAEGLSVAVAAAFAVAAAAPAAAGTTTTGRATGAGTVWIALVALMLGSPRLLRQDPVAKKADRRWFQRKEERDRHPCPEIEVKVAIGVGVEAAIERNGTGGRSSSRMTTDARVPETHLPRRYEENHGTPPPASLPIAVAATRSEKSENGRGRRKKRNEEVPQPAAVEEIVNLLCIAVEPA